MSKLTAFPKPDEPLHSLDEWVKRTHELALKSENIYIDFPHAKERMLERKISVQQVYDVLKHGKGVNGPTLDTYGCWRIKLERYSAGRLIQVVVVVKKHHLEVVTVIGKGGKL
jgi:hypothetical protein